VPKTFTAILYTPPYNTLSILSVALNYIVGTNLPVTTLLPPIVFNVEDGCGIELFSNLP